MEFQNNTELSNFQTTVLTISCKHAICASQLKHQRTSLLKFFHSSGLSNISQINIRVVHPTQGSEANQRKNPSSNSHSINESKQSYNSQSLANDTRAEYKEPAPLSHNSIKSIENCYKRIPNEKLAESLSNLVATLKNSD